MSVRVRPSLRPWWLAASTLVLMAGGADAQSIAARCQGMKDPTGCACALENGGTASDRTWARGPDKAAFDACVTDRGGSLGQKRATIPARR